MTPFARYVQLVAGLRHEPAAVKGLRTHCRHGHEYTEANTYWGPDGKRDCRACGRVLWAKKRRKRQQSPPGG